MVHLIKKIKAFILILTVLTVHNGFANKTDETLPKTIIFKVKEQFRSQCDNSSIAIASFNQLFAEIGVGSLEKIFPNKKYERRAGFIDLSLIYELHYTNTYSIEEVVKKMNDLNVAEYTEAYYLPQPTYTPSDTSLPIQYYINLINAENAWNITTGDTNIVIGITDTGWDPIHLDLVGNVKVNYADPINGSDDDSDGYIDNYLGWDLGMNDNDALWESLSHGVNVTGIAAAVTDNITGISGVGFKSKFLPVKISNNIGLLTDAYQGVVYAADHGCFVINCSWGSYDSTLFAKNIIDYAIINKGCLVVAAAGNDNSDSVFYPAGYVGVLSVAATDQNDIKLGTSNYGSYIDVSAPGGSIYTTGPGGYSTNSGTSMAVPMVSGGAALLKAQFPSYTNAQITAIIKSTADDLNVLNPSYANELGSGRLNLFNAVSMIIEENESTIKIYPNPSKGTVRIEGDEKLKKILLRNILGEMIQEFNKTELDISSYPNGIYFIEVVTENGSFTKKLLLAK